jgi:hypothetical protein
LSKEDIPRLSRFLASPYFNTQQRLSVLGATVYPKLSPNLRTILVGPEKQTNILIISVLYAILGCISSAKLQGFG